jgi:hypothetical protein
MLRLNEKENDQIEDENEDEDGTRPPLLYPTPPEEEREKAALGGVNSPFSNTGPGRKLLGFVRGMGTIVVVSERRCRKMPPLRFLKGIPLPRRNRL